MLVALVMATSASAQSSPADAVYNPNQDVLTVVNGGGPSAPPPQPAPTAVATPEAVPVEDTPPAGGVESESAPQPTPEREVAATAPVVQDSGDLPFTGFEAGLIAAAGLALVAAGFAMRRLSRNHA